MLILFNAFLVLSYWRACDFLWAFSWVELSVHTHTLTTVLRLSGFCPGQSGWAGTRRNIHPFTSIVVINGPLSASSIYYDPCHPPCSIYVPDSLFPQSFSKFSLVYLLAWHPQLHTPYISSSIHCLLFAAHAHTIATCFAVVRLCHLILIALSTLYLELSSSLMPHTHLTILISARWNATSFSFSWARSHFHTVYYFAHNYCTISLSLSMIYPYW